MSLLRDMTRGDLPRVAELEGELFGAEAWSPWLLAAELEATTAAEGRLPDRRYVVVEDQDGAVAGYAGLYHAGGAGDADLLTIGTAPAQRRRGLAALMLDELIGTARDLGCPAILLEVRRSNTGAQRLYRAHGFIPIGLRRRYYQEPREDAVVMRRELRERPGPVGAEAV